MKRRDFLKILSAAPLVAAVPALAKADIGGGTSNEAAYITGDVQVLKNEYPSGFINWKTPEEYLRMAEASDLEQKGWIAKLNGKEIPLVDVVNPDGTFSNPDYMKDGDKFEFKSPYIGYKR